MTRKLPLLTLGMTLTLSMQASEWADDLVSLNPDIIDSVVYLPSTVYGPKSLRSYMIYYHQPLQHDQPELGDLPLRALLTMRYKEDVTNKVTQVNIGGYGLDENIIEYPNYYANYFYSASSGELAGRYRGNLLQPEHRYFGTSCPEAPWSTLGYCEAKEAAADFHALIEAMKKVFHGRWAISGVSKGGTTAAIQQAYYPQDADCFVCYSGPFLGNVGDTRMQEHWMHEAWTHEMRQTMLHIQKEILNRPDIYPLYRRYYGWGDEYDDWDEYLRCYMLLDVGLLDSDLHAYKSREEVNNLFANNQEYLNRLELDDYTDEMLLYMMKNSSPAIDGDYESWYNENFQSKGNTGSRCASERLNGKGHTHELHLPLPVFSIDKQYWNLGNISYYYQASHELGYFDLKWDFFYETQAEADSVNAMWRHQTHNVLAFGFDLFSGVEFNPGLMDDIRHNTANTESNMLFIYGQDDLWTGAHMDDDCVNGVNVRQYILSAQNHSASINAERDWDLQDELWAFTDDILDPLPEAITTTRYDDANASPAIYYDLFGRRLDNHALRNRLVVKKENRLLGGAKY